jgi:asparagine N-glycosylation enzyme membrane subunit Stt3
MTKYYKYAHWLSLDVVLGAVLCHCMSARLSDSDTQINWFVIMILASVVFFIYLIDRILDNQKELQPTDRHQFQNQYKDLLIKIVMALVAISVIMLFLLPKAVLWFGVGLGLVVGLYLLAVYKNKSASWFVVYKDVFVPIIYSLGVWGTALALQPKISWEGYVLGIVFWFVVQQSLLSNAYFESFTIESGESLPIIWGEDKTQTILKMIFVLVVLICVVSAVITDNRFALRTAFVLVLMASINQWLVIKPQKWLDDGRYRFVLEGVFLMPILIL